MHAVLRLPATLVMWIRALAYRGDRDAIAEMRKQLSARGSEPLGLVEGGLILADVFLGRTSRQAFYALGDETETEGVSARRRALVCQVGAEVAGFAGDTPRAVHLIEIAGQSGLFDLLWMERCPLLDAIRGEPRFRAVLASVARRADAMSDAMWTRDDPG